MIASCLLLNKKDFTTYKIKDPYSLHRVVYSLFPDGQRSDHDKESSVPSGFLFVDKGGDYFGRKLLLLSEKEPVWNGSGSLECKKIPDSFLNFDRYQFEVVVNPTKRDQKTGKTVPVIGRENIFNWMIERGKGSWGMEFDPVHLQVEKISVLQFEKKGHQVTHQQAQVMGSFKVIDREKFRNSFEKGIGRGRTFGSGFLQIIPIAVK